MDVNLNSNESLVARIQQLEHERDELHKDIEQLCMQQAGPGYLVVATKLHFQRTASLEQEIENLKKKLAASTRENLNLQEELSEAYRIKSQLADLHQAEVAKNIEAEKQLKFFQGCVASAFAERDHSIMEAEKAKEKEELMSQKFNDFQNRLEELTSDFLEQKRLSGVLKNDLAKQEEQNENFKKLVNKFYEIKQQSFEEFEDTSWDDKCACLLHEPSEFWSYKDTSTSKYISALEEELEKVRKSVDNLQSKLRVGLEIENHLKKRVQELENKLNCLSRTIMSRITELRHYHSQHKVDIMNLLNEERLHIKSVIDMIEEKVGGNYLNREKALGPSHSAINLHKNESRDVQLSNGINTSTSYQESKNDVSETVTKGEDKVSEVLVQAMQEKIAALLLLSQVEERHLLERNVNAALEKKLEELQRNLLQVTNEKVKALMELAQLKQEYQQFQEKTGHEIQQGNSLANNGGKRLIPYDRDGRIRNLLKKTYLKRWIGASYLGGSEEEAELNREGNSNLSSKGFNNIDLARMKIEIATLKESMESMDHLTSSIHRLRLALLKARESVSCKDADMSMSESLHNIISEAKLLKTALGSSLPISWSAETDDTSASLGDSISGGYNSEKMDTVSAVGFEMVELLILAAQILQESSTRKDIQDNNS